MPGHDARRTLGAAGEDAACAHLERRGYRILARNARADRVELDVVAERAGVLVFVEVKTRRGDRCGAAAEAVDARKQARIARGAAAWLRASRRRVRRIRFDVITCEPAPRGGFRVTHWEAAFDADSV
jgi:putative endonuclease